MPYKTLIALVCLGLVAPLPAEEAALTPTAMVVHAPVLPQDALSGWSLMDVQLQAVDERQLRLRLNGNRYDSGGDGLDRRYAGTSTYHNDTTNLDLSLQFQRNMTEEAKDLGWTLPISFSQTANGHTASNQAAWPGGLDNWKTEESSARWSLRAQPSLTFVRFNGPFQWGSGMGLDVEYRNTEGSRNEVWTRSIGGTPFSRSEESFRSKDNSSNIAGNVHLRLGLGRVVETRWGWQAASLLQELSRRGLLLKGAGPAEAQALSNALARQGQAYSWDAREQAMANAMELSAMLADLGLIAVDQPKAVLVAADARNYYVGLRPRGSEVYAMVRATDRYKNSNTSVSYTPGYAWMAPGTASYPSGEDGVSLAYSLEGAWYRPLGMDWELGATALGRYTPYERRLDYYEEIYQDRDRAELGLRLGYFPSTRWNLQWSSTLSMDAVKRELRQLGFALPVSTDTTLALSQSSNLNLVYQATYDVSLNVGWYLNWTRSARLDPVQAYYSDEGTKAFLRGVSDRPDQVYQTSQLYFSASYRFF